MMVQGQEVSKPSKEVATQKEEQVRRKEEQEQEPCKERRSKVSFYLSDFFSFSLFVLLSGPGRGLLPAEGATPARHQTPTPPDRAATLFLVFGPSFRCLIVLNNFQFNIDELDQIVLMKICQLFLSICSFWGQNRRPLSVDSNWFSSSHFLSVFCILCPLPAMYLH